MNQFVPPGAGAPLADGAISQPVFSGDGRRFVGLLFRGGLLQLITLGFYRFWLLTDIRRHLWSATSVEGDALEYTGRGRELLIGFLFAIAILAPFFLIYFLIGIEVERYRAFASLPLYALLYVFGQFATYRARRYRLTRTVWRGVRFWMTGSGWSYALRSVLWLLLVILTLGVAYPWREAALERYKMGNSRYGDLQGAFVGTGWGLFKATLLIWVIAVAIVGGFAGSAIYLASLSDGATHLARISSSAAAIGFIPGLMMLILILLWPIYQAIEWRWWLAGVRFGDVAFESAFPRTRILTLYLRYIAYVFAASIVVGIVIFAAAMGLRGAMTPEFVESMRYGWIALAVLGYLLVLLGLGIVYRYLLQHQLWRAIVDTLEIRNLSASANAVAQGAPVNALGEGLLDGLDMAGF